MGKRMRSILKQVVSCLLVLTMLVNLPLGHLPNVFADEVSNQEILAPVIPEEDEVSDETQLIEPEGDYVSWEESANALTGEINERREQNIKHFMREDGSIEAVTYPYSVHYENEDEWVDIDNTLVFDEINKTYRTNSNSFQTSFSSDVLSDELVNMTNGGTELSWVIPEMSEAEVEIENPGESTDMRYNNKLFSKVTYKDALNGIDVQYVIGPDGIQEYFVVENKEELEALEDITIVMKTNNLEASENRDIVRFRDGTGRAKFTLGQPVMFDSNGENVKEIPFELETIKQSDISKEVIQETKAPIITSAPIIDESEIIMLETEIPAINSEELSDTTKLETVEPETTEFIELEEVIETDEVIENTFEPDETTEAVEETEEIIKETLEPVESLDGTEVPIETEVAANDIELVTEIPEVSTTEPIVEEIIEEKEVLSKTEAYINEISKIIDEANSNEENYYTYTLNLVEELPKAEDITFPLIIDPDIKSDTAKENIDDSFISSSATTVNYGAIERLKVGRGDTSGINRAFIKFNTLPAITSGDMVVSASLVMPRYMDENTDQTHVGFDAQLNVHNVTSSWTETGITWDNDPTFDSKIASVDFSEFFDVDTGVVSVNVFDITNIAKGWYQNTIPNYGVMVKNADEGEYGEYHEFGSGEMKYYPTHHPVLSVVYVNAAGLEDSYSYHEQAIGRAGTSYINDATGHMTLVHSDVATTDLMMPASLFHTYNTSLKDVQSGYGKGFRISFDQTITAKTINNKSYYEYIDEDGTKHYFYQDDSNSNLYYDERNKNNKLTISGTTATLVYGESHITKVFESNKLIYIRDTNGNEIEITRDSGSRVNYIMDPSGNTITLNYNDTGDKLLKEIISPGCQKTEFSYDTNGRLINIDYPDGCTTTYSYNSSGYMSQAKNHDGYGINYSYSGNPLKISQVREFDANNQYAYLKFNYGHLVTTVTDSDGDISHYRFNNFGQLISEQDKDGNAVYYDYASSTPGKKDQLKVSSDIQKTSINLLGNGNFVSNTGWWSVYNSATDASSITISDAGNVTANSLYINKTISSASSYIYATTTVGVNETYDFSAYVKYGGTADIYIYVEYRDAAGEKYITKKPVIANADDWTKNYISVEIPSIATGTIYTGILMPSGTSSAVYLDDAQLTKGGGGERTTLIVNGDFSNGTTGWTTTSCSSSDVVTTLSDAQNYKPSNFDDKAFKMVGDINTVKYLYQTVSISGNSGDTYVAGAYVKADSIPYFQNTKSDETESTDYGKIILRIAFINNGYVVKQVDKEFSDDTSDWQYLSSAATATSAYTAVRVEIIYVRNQNQMYVDGISLYKEGFGLNYTYNQDNNDLTKVETKDGEVYQYTYDDNHNLKESINKYGDVTSYTYYSNHNLDTVTAFGKKTDYDYDSRGNVSVTKIYDEANANYFLSKSTYHTTKNQKVSDIDARGNTISYDYQEATDVNGYGQIEKITDAKGSITYTYDNIGRVKTVEDSKGSVEYVYTRDNLNGIQLYDSNDNYKYRYILAHNIFGQLTGTVINTSWLSTNEYDSYKKYLTKTTFANGYVRTYEYDDRDILVAEKEGSEEIYRNYYASNGRLYQKRDNKRDSTIHYDYDDKDRIKRVYEDKDSGNDTSVTYTYNDKDQVSIAQKIYGGTGWGVINLYTDNNELDISRSSFSTTADYDYDGLGRISKKTLGQNIQLGYGYETGTVTGSTTGLVNVFACVTQDGIEDRISYSYDETGLISCQDGLNETIHYYYDSRSQLTEVYNETENITNRYSYDSGGNITTKYTYYGDVNDPESIDIKAYTYDSTWDDLLVWYDGETIEYDAIGNPTKYLEYEELTWNGRQLVSIKDGEYPVAGFQYNSDGLRVAKNTLNGSTEYAYIGGELSVQKDSQGNALYFSYDANGDIISVHYEGSDYYYIKNPQGDVIAITDEAGSVIDRYTYDEWGYPTSTPTTPIGNLNPFRYRGYIYDKETGFYYVSSRYYDPETGRWINADIPETLTADFQNMNQYNLFAYCFNNPINMYDPTGTWPTWGQVLTAVSIVAISACVVAAIVVAAPAVAGAVSTIAAYYGASAAVGSALATATTIGCVGVATGTALTGANRAVESVTGTNYGAKLMGSNNYDNFEFAVNFSSALILSFPTSNSYPSTGRSKPKNLNEQVGMNLAKTYPEAGNVIVKSLGDPRMPGWLGWQKYQINYPNTGVNIHYVGNKYYHFYFDFKFKE